MAKGLFVTATGTDVGKTFLSALIVKKLADAGKNIGYYKAALSGAELRGGKLVAGDADYVYRTARLNGDPNDSVSYIFEPAVSPHLASQITGVRIEKEKIKADFEKAKAEHDFLLMEGSGGIICPISVQKDEPIMLADLIKLFHLPVVIVSDAGLGSINAAMLTIHYAQAQGIEISAVLLNRYRSGDAMERDNKKMINELSGIPVYTCGEGGSDLEIPLNVLENFFQDV